VGRRLGPAASHRDWRLHKGLLRQTEPTRVSQKESNSELMHFDVAIGESIKSPTTKSPGGPRHSRSGRDDFSCPYIIGFGSSPSRCGPSRSRNI
jgi:hypothetical protein